MPDKRDVGVGKVVSGGYEQVALAFLRLRVSASSDHNDASACLSVLQDKLTHTHVTNATAIVFLRGFPQFDAHPAIYPLPENIL